MIIKFAKEIYPKSALIKAAYHFTSDYYIYLNLDEKDFLVEITPKSDAEEDIVSMFKNELLAQTARLVVFSQTANLRKIIMARAFASTIIDQEDVNEQKYEMDGKGDIDNILNDWFEKNG